MLKLFKWLDANLLTVFSGFLLIFIPLYPKLPLLDAIPGYIVRIRLEDILISVCIFIYLIRTVRGKTRFTQTPLIKPIVIYLLIGFLSMLSAVFIINTVPMESLHISKMVLHFFRRIEYFSLFFIFYASVRSLKIAKIYIFIFLLTILLVALYGFGQKYLYWPAFSTMNREFSKGWVLYLTKHARVLSTFGGHYDLAAFIMMSLVILWSLFFGLKKLILKGAVFLIIACAFWTLILTASRTSFLAYLFGLSVMFLFWGYKKGLKWSSQRWIVVMSLSIIVMLSFGDLSERFTKLLRIDERISGVKSLLLSPIGRPPEDKALFLENNPEAALAQITSKSDQPPTIGRPSDVYQDIPLLIPSASGSAVISVSRTYSKTAFMYDLSTAIRFDALWPMAINGFKKNLILGSGYSTLNKSQPTHFTEAESTDNDYLRSLGETGILGFISFYGILFIVVYIVWRNLLIINDPVFFSFSVGLVGLLAGLLMNAVYIDVFESSKVALSFWALSGITLAGVATFRKSYVGNIPKPEFVDWTRLKQKIKIRLVNFIKSDIFIILLILLLAFYLRLYKIKTPLADWHSWRQADTAAVTRNYVNHGVNILYPTYDDLSNVASGKDNPKGLRMVEFPLYNVLSVAIDKLVVGYNVELTGRLTSIFASLISIVFLFLIVRKYGSRWEAALSALIFAILPYNIYYSRVILPEPLLVTTGLGMLYFLDRWLEEMADSSKLTGFGKHAYLILGLILSASGLLIKPYAAFLLLPMAFLWIRNLGINIKSIAGLAVFTIVSFLPFVWWRWWVSHFPEGIPAFTWLLNGDGIRFKGAFFYWLFADRLSRLISGYWGLPLLITGIFAKAHKESWFYYLWGLAMLFYVTVFATGNIRHDYYQIITIPIIVIFMAKGIVFLWKQTRNGISKFSVLGFLFTVILFMEMFGWYHIRDFYNINHPEIVEAGFAVEKKTPQKSLVIAPYNGDTAFLYQTNRAGWPIMQEDIDSMIKRGASFYVSVVFDDLTKSLIRQAQQTDPANQRFKIVELTDKFVLIQLVSDSLLPR